MSHSPASGAGIVGNALHHGLGASTIRRRTRSSKNLAMALQQSQNQNLIQPALEAMDVEEDGGRERKRIARR